MDQRAQKCSGRWPMRATATGGKQVVPLKKEAAQVHFMFERFADRPSLSEQAGALQCILNGGYSLSRAN